MIYCKMFIFALIFNSTILMAQEISLNHASQIKRASYLLKGVNASKVDFDNLSNMVYPNDRNNFVEQKISEYLEDKKFIAKMQERLNELFRVQIGHHNKSENERDNEISHDGSMNKIFEDLLENNESWDVLLTKKEYKISTTEGKESEPRGLSDASFYDYNSRKNLVKEVELYLDSVNSSNLTKKSVYVYRPPDKQSSEALAGVLTTNRFYTRYPTTRLNKNRKRAGAIFRVFLCDNMTPALSISNQDNIDLLKMATSESKVSNDLASIEAKHGEDPQCKSCHYKLDPAAQTFVGAATYPNRKGSPGGLVYKRADGTTVNISVNGIGELGEAIVKQPEYLQCQVQHFWDWFIGNDIPLTENKKKSLASVFDKMNRRPKDFIKYLLTSSDFSRPETLKINDIRHSHVKPILQRCDSCHQSVSWAPILGQSYPYSSKSDINDSALGQLIWATDLKEISAKDFMPPTNAGWSLEGYERDLLKAWIKGGAKSDDGKTMISNTSKISNVKNQIELSGLLSEKLKPQFGLTYLRYVNNFDIFNTISNLFGDYRNYAGSCNLQDLEYAERMTLGMLNPSTGKALFVKPSPELILKIKKCVEQSAFYALSNYTIASDTKEFLHPEITKNFTGGFFSNLLGQKQYVNISDVLWKELSSNQKETQVKYSIEFMIGNGILLPKYVDEMSINLIQAIEILEQESKNEVTLADALKNIYGVIATSAEFLTY